MQYDLFHAYTVDAHTLFVVSNLRRLAIPKFNHEFPALSQIMQSLRGRSSPISRAVPRHRQGRGGDHSELGAVDARGLLLEQGLARTRRAWSRGWCATHLILSITRRRGHQRSRSHPRVREDRRRPGASRLFVRVDGGGRAGHQPQALEHLEGAPVRGVLRTHQARAAPGLETPVDQEELIRETQAHARERMPSIPPEAIAAVWSQWTEAYFLRYTPEEIAWQTTALAGRDSRDDSPFVAIRQLSERGGTAVLTYTPHHLHSFARTTAVLDQMGLNVVDARLITSANGFSLETYVVLEDNGAVIADPERITEIERGLWRNLRQPEDSPLTVTRRAARQVRNVLDAHQVNCSVDSRNARTILE